MTDDFDDIASAFRIPDAEDHPAEHYKRLLDLPEHSHLKDGEAVVGWMFRVEPKIKGGRHVLGTVYMPRVQGDLKDLFDWMLDRLLGYTPEFLIVLDWGYWDSVSPREREILVYHEMQHMQQAVDAFGSPRFNKETGRPIWRLVGHDIEEFDAVARRYGAWADDIKRFVDAVNEGEYRKNFG